jgi:hypothetical protein
MSGQTAAAHPLAELLRRPALQAPARLSDLYFRLSRRKRSA